MGMIDKLKDSEFLEDAAERAIKTFGQFYLGYWLFLNPGVEGVVTPDAFDTLFTADNLKAGVVGLALSAVFSLGSKKFGKNKDSASLVK